MLISNSVSVSTRNFFTLIYEANVLRTLVFPTLVATIALAVPIIGAVLIGDDSGIDGVNGFVESLSGDSSSFLGDLGLLAPLGFAFAAGMASAVNPCGFAMLPAYLGLYLGSSEEGDEDVHPVRHLGRALLVGGSVTAGFVVLFGTAGTVIGWGLAPSWWTSSRGLAWLSASYWPLAAHGCWAVANCTRGSPPAPRLI